MIVYHVSEDPEIEVFEPRKAASSDERLVWAIDDAHLRNYLVPRECPRVTYSAGPCTTVADRELASMRLSSLAAGLVGVASVLVGLYVPEEETPTSAAVVRLDVDASIIIAAATRT